MWPWLAGEGWLPTASNEDMLRKQDKAIAQDLDAIAKAKYGGAVGKSHVAAFNRRVRIHWMYWLTGTDWIVCGTGKDEEV